MANLNRLLTLCIYLLSLNIFAIFLKYLEISDFLCNYFKGHKKLPSNVYDYIVVGSGSAGSIVARRLLEDENINVLILEAGGERNSILDAPAMGVLLQQTSYDWQFKTIPQIKSCQSLKNNESIWPMGKIVGGSSMLNNMVYIRGHPGDFTDWFSEENYNYYGDILPYFKKLESAYSDGNFKGSVPVNNLKYTSILADVLLDAAKSLNFATSQENIDCNYGFAKPKLNILNGKRWTSSHTLHAENKPNMYLYTNSLVEKVLFKDNYEAYAVKYWHLNQYHFARATKGIILSAGVIGSPKILMLSGIGHENHLRNLNIPPKINLPVGDNLQDHISTGIDLVLLNQTLHLGIEEMISPFAFLQYFWNSDGPWTTVGCEGVAFFNRKQLYDDYITSSNSTIPEIQFMIMPLSINQDDGVHLRKLLGINDKTYSNYFRLSNETRSITILPVLLHPRSRGTVRLKDKNVFTQPLINPNYLNDDYDVEILLAGIELIKKFIKALPLQKLGAKLNNLVLPGCENYKFDTKNYWECYVRHLTITSYHPIGTCKMAAEETSVVNTDFQVRGTNKLYIVDASVMPSLTSGNINGAVMMLAEKAVDVIKYHMYLQSESCDLIELFISKDFC